MPGARLRARRHHKPTRRPPRRRAALDLVITRHPRRVLTHTHAGSGIHSCSEKRGSDNELSTGTKREEEGAASQTEGEQTTDQVAHPRASDPSSRHFERQHPRRASRTGPYAHVALNHTYVDPVEARRPDTVRNVTLMALALAVVPAFAFYSCVSPISDLDSSPPDECTARPLAMPTVVQPTTDLGDVAIPRGYRQAVDSQHSQYWLDAINRERGKSKELNHSFPPSFPSFAHFYYIVVTREKARPWRTVLV